MLISRKSITVCLTTLAWKFFQGTEIRVDSYFLSTLKIFYLGFLAYPLPFGKPADSLITIAS